jgi:hypothetical protein
VNDRIITVQVTTAKGEHEVFKFRINDNVWVWVVNNYDAKLAGEGPGESHCKRCDALEHKLRAISDIVGNLSEI